MPQTPDKSTVEQRHDNNGTPTNTKHNQQKQEIMLELRKYILLLASLVATVTYAAGFSPPGDVWQDTDGDHLAGDPIIRDTHHKLYVTFFYCNATAFAASLVVIVFVLILASLDDDKESSSPSWIVRQYRTYPRLAIRPLQLVMVVDLLSLMGAYAAGTCRDRFTTIYSSVLVGFVFFYVIVQVTVASCFTDTGSGGGGVPAKLEDVEKEEEARQKAKERFRKVLMLLATFAVSITYSAGLSTPGGFWDSHGGHRPGDAILRDRHNTRLAVFFGFNTMAFVASLLIIVVLLDTKLRKNNAYGFIVVALVSLIGAYNAGSCRHTDTTVYVFSLIPAVLLYVSFLYFVAGYVHDKREGLKKLLRVINRNIWLRLARAASDGGGEDKTEEKAADKARSLVRTAVPPTPSVRGQQPSTPASDGRENTNGGRAKEGNNNTNKTEKEKAADKARSLVLLLATLAATITYQAGLDPPGGVWQDNSGGHTAGDPILLTTNPRRYKAFFYCNSVALAASLVAIVLVQKKLLLTQHVLEAVMILDLFGLIGAYAAGSCRDVNTSIHAMALAGAVLVYVVIHVIFITLDDDTRARSESDREKDKELVEKTRKRLLLFAILAATITYQAGLTPPGGFLLQDDQSGHHAGDPVLLYNFPRRYKAFFYCNSVSFMLSIALIILLVNPYVYRPAIRSHALSVCMAAGLFGLMGAYAAGSTQHLKTSIYVFVLIAVVLVCIALLFLVFLLTGGTKAPATADSKGDTATTQGATMEAGTQVEAPTISNSNAAAAAAAAQGAAISETNTQLAVTKSNNTSSTQNSNDENKREHANRKYLMVVGILVASVTYQAGLEPPGEAWQSNSGWHEAGNPVMHDNRRPRYLAFFYSNSTSFMASIVVILLLLVPPENLIGTADNNKWRKKWHVVMNTTIVLVLLGLLGAYAAGSSRRWQTSVYVLLLVIAVLVYMAFHLVLSSAQLPAKAKINSPSPV